MGFSSSNTLMPQGFKHKRGRLVRARSLVHMSPYPAGASSMAPLAQGRLGSSSVAEHQSGVTD